jgi:aminopeptidase N
MLRNYLGDEVFFAALNLYLEKNKFSSVEFHQLRLAFEEVSGEDLNWFFNQWFLKAGHPNISVSYQYNDTSKSLCLSVFQQNAEKNNLYKLPVAIDLYVKGKKERMNVVIEKQKEVYNFSIAQAPDWVSFDADKVLVAEVSQEKSVPEWMFQYNKTSLYADKIQALAKLSTYLELATVQELFLKAMNDASPEIKKYAIKQSGILVKYVDSKLKQTLIKLVQKDENAQVRAEAIVALGENYISNDLLNIYKKSLEDKSYLVQSKTLQNIYYYDKELGMAFSKSFEKDSSIAIISALAQIYAESGTEKENDFFVSNIYRFKDADKYTFAKQYSKFLLNKNDSLINNGLLLLEDIATQDKLWYIRLAGFNGINVLKNMYNNKQKEAIAKIDLLNRTKPNSPQIKQLQSVVSQTERQINRITSIISSIKTTEKNTNLLEIYRSN